MKNKIFALIDCNSFYASCEKIFRPDLKDKPVVVLSNNDGCVVALSKEAKKAGIKRGVPLFKIMDIVKKNDVVYFSSNYELYGDISSRVMNLLGEFSPDVEIYSIDEAFIDLTGIKHHDLAKYAKLIKSYIMKCTGIPISIGIGESKTLAKLANKIGKDYEVFGGVFNIVNHKHKDKIFKSYGVHNIWGIGFQYTKMLHRHNINTIYDFTMQNDEWVKKKMTSMGLLTLWELRGISCIELEKDNPDNKQIICSRSFGSPVHSLKELEEAVAFYITRASIRLREQKCLCGGLIVFIATNRFKDTPQYGNSAFQKIDIPTSYTPTLIRYGHELLKKIYKKGYEYKKAGIVMIELIYEKNRQLMLFEDVKTFGRENQLNNAIDRINGNKNIIHTGGFSKKNSWMMKREYKSPCYTTRWEELPVVKA